MKEEQIIYVKRIKMILRLGLAVAIMASLLSCKKNDGNDELYGSVILKIEHVWGPTLSDDASEETPSATAKATQTKPLVNTKGKFLKIPDRFQLQFLRYDPGTGKLSNAEHYKFHPCVCTNVSVNYTPDGQYVSFKDAIAALDSTSDKPNSQILVPAVEVGLSFAETRFVTQADIAAGY